MSDCVRMRDGAERARHRRVIVKNILSQLMVRYETTECVICRTRGRQCHKIRGSCEVVGGPSLPKHSGGGDNKERD